MRETHRVHFVPEKAAVRLIHFWMTSNVWVMFLSTIFKKEKKVSEELISRTSHPIPSLPLLVTAQPRGIGGGREVLLTVAREGYLYVSRQSLTVGSKARVDPVKGRIETGHRSSASFSTTYGCPFTGTHHSLLTARWRHRAQVCTTHRGNWQQPQ